MEKRNTRERIMDAALDLFAVCGFEAASVSQIADAVGIRKASLYSHFESKQDILDSLVAVLTEHYESGSLFSQTEKNGFARMGVKEGVTPDDIVKMVQGQIRFVLHDPQISRVRKMLVIEQFRNTELAQLQGKQSYEDIMKYNTALMKELIRLGVLADHDPEIMAAQFAMPVSMWTNLCDREPDREEEVMNLIDRHIRQFMDIYKK